MATGLRYITLDAESKKDGAKALTLRLFRGWTNVVVKLNLNAACQKVYAHSDDKA